MSESGIYRGVVKHRRFSPHYREFTYQLSLYGIDVDEVDELSNMHRIFGTRWFHPIRFCEKDYLRSEPGNLKQRIINKVQSLGGQWGGGKVMMLAQCRSFGVYFSPINFYFCIDQDKQCRLMLAEVSNTPWNERHYYLVELNNNEPMAKAFHVSPFMPLDMNYRWRVKPLGKKAFVYLANHEVGIDGVKVFDVTMALTKQPISTFGVFKNWLSLPFAVIKVVTLIYWQAIKIFIQGIKFIPYKKK
jgi:DUF1365 family protein